jgi:hypothetical protein
MSEQVRDYRVDKSDWPDGPWKEEPDRVDFVHAGYACFLLRNDRMGQWCGYVGVDRVHPFYGKKYDDVDVEVHGGLTYSDTCKGQLCHVPQPGMPDDVWWFGFDAAHCYDLVPGMLARELNVPALREFALNHLHEDTYRDLAYMKRETEALAEQLRERAG